MGCNQSRPKRKNSQEHVVPKTIHVADGRRFHNIENSKYFLPNDDDEVDRLHLQHYMWRYIWQSNYSSPVTDLLKEGNANVLDSGCGAGSWLFELATEFPASSFTGIDMSPITPTTIKPRNVDFIQSNILDGFMFEDNTFDFVYQRLLVIAFPHDKWQGVIDELVRVLKPGGYLEIMEVNPLVQTQSPSTNRLGAALKEFMLRNGQDPLIVHKMQSFMEANGQLENIVQEEKFGPYGKSAGRLGEIGVENHIALFTSLKPRLLTIMNVISEEYDDLVINMAKEMSDYNTYNHSFRIYGRKKFL